MRRVKIVVTVLAGVAVCFFFEAAEAFHGPGGGACDGCHSMHSTQSVRPLGSASLLRESDTTAICLSCHMAPVGTSSPSGIYIATSASDMPAGVPPSQLSPGGDFGWLKKEYSWRSKSGEEIRSEGDRHGHNIVSPRFGLTADRRNLVAPLGSYPAQSLTCISCHDPHGGYGRYRLLGSRGYQPKSLVGEFMFTAGPPVAVSPARFNKGEASGDIRVAYGSGFSEWCGNCHSTSGESGMKHPAGASARLSAEIIGNYNRYVATGDVSGDPASSYTSLIPFEMGIDDTTTLSHFASSDGSIKTGPGTGGGSPTVMCLTCHRAHASGWDGMARWNTKSEFLVYNGGFPGIDNGAPHECAQGRTSAETRRAYYDRMPTAFAGFQRSLCNKCHIKD